MKRLLAMLMALVMVLGLFAGCGGDTAPVSEETPDASVEVSAEAPTAEAPAEAPAENPAEAETSEAAAENVEIPAEPETVGRGITLPIQDKVLTYSYWLCYAPFAAELVNTDTMEGIVVLDKIQELSNIHFDITAANGAAEQDNFNLMIAAGDYTDIIFTMSYYATGLEGAVEEDIIQDLADVLPEKCPSYWSLLTSDATTLMQAYTDSGYMPTICTLVPEVGQEVVGPVIRKDWLDDFGMEMPQTMDELYDYLEKSYQDKGAEMVLATTDGLIGELAYGLNLNLAGFTVEDGEVKYSLAEDNMKEYLKFMNKCYTAGVISQDFFAATNEDLGSKARLNFGLGLNSLVGTAANNTSDIMMNVADDNFEMAVLPYVGVNAEDENHVGPETLQGLMKDVDAWAFSTECENIDPLLDLVEWLYSDEAYLLTNYGVENESYTLDENGNPQYTDLITNNPDGLSYFFASYVYATNAAWGFVPFINDMSRTYYDFNDNQWQVYEDLKQLSDCAYNYPTYAVMTTDESAEYASISSDMGTYQDSKLLEFIVGSADIDAEFDTYVETLYDMGLQDMIDLKQAAYDRAVERMDSLGA